MYCRSSSIVLTARVHNPPSKARPSSFSFSMCSFLDRCKRSPYHYAAECDDVVRLTREWALWLTEGKATFLRAVAEQDKEHMALLLEHEGKRKKHDLAVEEASAVVSCFRSFCGARGGAGGCRAVAADRWGYDSKS